MTVHCFEMFGKARGQYKYVLVYNYHKWSRSCAHRGYLNSKTLYIRKMTPVELEESRESTREIAYLYESFDQLREDESAYGVDVEKLIG